MGDDGTPCDVEPNNGPCVVASDVERAVIVLDQYRNPTSNEAKLMRLRKQLASIEAIEMENERKLKVINDIADIRAKIMAKGEIPCA